MKVVVAKVELGAAEHFPVAIALTSALTDGGPRLRRALFQLATDKATARYVLELLAKSWPGEYQLLEKKGRSGRAKRPAAEPEAPAKPAGRSQEPDPDEELGTKEVCEELGMSHGWFALQIKKPDSLLAEVAYKKGSRWKVKRRDVVALAKHREAKKKGKPDTNGTRAWPAASVGL